MSKSAFKFKQFTVKHDKCAMKVGTDGVLLGAWASVSGVSRILDIGTGSGLIALMLAQRSEAHITAIDIDPAAVEQALENAGDSPWPGRIHVDVADLCAYTTPQPFDLIVSNPPFFENSLHSPTRSRTVARHTDTLPLPLLIQKSAELLSQNGLFSVILPASAEDVLLEAASSCKLFPRRITKVVTTPGALPKRILAEFSFSAGECLHDTLLIEEARHQYSEQYIALTRSFYLKM